jgi:hypothetical protein
LRPTPTAEFPGDEPAQKPWSENSVREGGQADQQQVEEEDAEDVDHHILVCPLPELHCRIDGTDHDHEGECEHHRYGIIRPAQGEQDTAGEERGTGKQGMDSRAQIRRSRSH